MVAAHEQAAAGTFDFGPNGLCPLRPGLHKLLLLPCFDTPAIDYSNHHQPFSIVSIEPSCTVLTGYSLSLRRRHCHCTLGQHSLESCGKARCMPPASASLCRLPNRGMYHNDAQQNLILRGNGGAVYHSARHSLWSGLARILPLQERTTLCTRRSREVQPYAIGDLQAIVPACPREHRAGNRV